MAKKKKTTFKRPLHFGPKDSDTTVLQRHVDRTVKGLGLDPKKSMSLFQMFKHGSKIDKSMARAKRAARGVRELKSGLKKFKGKTLLKP
jgi:hypothetical protein